ncbi:MAG: GDP-mannose 4,6-dehydratase [bacterium]
MNFPQPPNLSTLQLSKAFLGKRVWLSGHTGFKGSWLSQWLLELGAVVHGYALAPETNPALFDQLGLAHRMEHEVADIRDAAVLKKSLLDFQPEFVFHMAAQPLVRRSYALPVETYETNVNGTIHVLEALRSYAAAALKGGEVESLKGNPNISHPLDPSTFQRSAPLDLQPLNSSSVQPSQHPIVAVIVTTDKCYENHESGRAYEETDSLGGHDPYSSSKAMAEIVTAAYRNSYFQNDTVRVATARAGNVIGGGDWAEDRIVPDAMRALNDGNPIAVRNPSAVRPWQHVLEPLSGYLRLAALLANTELSGGEVEMLKRSTTQPPHPLNLSPSKPLNPSISPLCSAFNFGPSPDSNRTVADLVTEILKHRSGEWTDKSDPKAVHEATLLNLSIDKARLMLEWDPHWGFEETITKTVEWYDRVNAGVVSPLEITRQQIAEYQKILP